MDMNKAIVGKTLTPNDLSMFFDLIMLPCKIRLDRETESKIFALVSSMMLRNKHVYDNDTLAFGAFFGMVTMFAEMLELDELTECAVLNMLRAFETVATTRKPTAI